MNLSAMFGPITTPFDKSGDVDAAAAAGNCRALVKQGVDGIVIAGSTGEAALLDEAERAALLDAIRKAVPTNRILMGIGGESTRQTIARAKAAAAGGADAVLCVAPHYYSAAMTDAALLAHYRAVADASPKPVVLYTIPKYMHFALSASLVAELAKHPNVIGIKDSSGDPAILAGYLQSQSDSFTVLTGNGAQWLNALRAGARGGILAVALFAPALSRTVFEAHRAGRDAEADAAQAKITPLAVEIVGKMGIGAIKVACEATGFVGGPVRGPLSNPDDAARRRVLELLDASGLQRTAAAAA
jgi:4-hydroxy-2-oxoglutarate aldolase